MIPFICIVLLFPLLTKGADNLTFSYQHPNPEAVVQEVQRSASHCQLKLHNSVLFHEGLLLVSWYIARFSVGVGVRWGSSLCVCVCGFPRVYLVRNSLVPQLPGEFFFLTAELCVCICMSAFKNFH